MSALSRFSQFDSGFAGIVMTAEQFLALGETQERYQLIEGVVVRMTRPTLRHQAAIKAIVEQLLPQERSCSMTLFIEVDWRIDDRTVYSPDLCCFATARAPAAGIAATLAAAPDLVIEVLSPGTKAFDLTTKRDQYERACVVEYWAIDPEDGQARVYTRSAGQLVESAVTGDVLQSASLPGVCLSLKPLRELAGLG